MHKNLSRVFDVCRADSLCFVQLLMYIGIRQKEREREVLGVNELRRKFVCLFVCLTTPWSRLRTFGVMKTGILE